MPTARVAENLELYYEISGSGPGLPVLLIMGLGSDLHMWEKQVPVLEKSRRVIVFDNRGVGRSGKPKGPYTTAMMADDAAALLDAIGVPRAHVVGVSLGGAIAQELAIHHGERLRSLALMATFGKPERAMQDTANEGARNLGGPDLGQMMQAVAAGGASIDPGIAIAFLQPLVLSKKFIEANRDYLRMIYERTAGYGFSSEGFAGQIGAALTHDTTARLATIGAPTLVVVAGADRLVPPAAGRKLAQAIPGARLVEIDGAPHGMNLERADDVNRILEGWLAEHD